MGGQACVFYGAAEFSRDLDLLILADASNLSKLAIALGELGANVIAVPDFNAEWLARGHAVHFRCNREDVTGLRIDLMSSLRGVAEFEDLWRRRTTIETEGEEVDLLAIEDLVQAKKTQRDKDWPMIRRLVEQSYYTRPPQPVEKAIRFWLRELRTPVLLVQVATGNPELAVAESPARPAIEAARFSREHDVEELLAAEERQERRKDREYWAPLKRELEAFRLGRSG